MDNVQQEAAKRAVRRALNHLGDAMDALATADKLSGNHDYMRMANEVGKVCGWVRDIAGAD